MLKKITFSLLVLLVILTGWQMLRMYSADECFEAADDYLNQGNIDKALYYSDKSIKLNPLEPNYYRERGKIYLLKTLNVENKDDVLYYKLLALENFQTAYDLNPYNLVTIRNLIPLYYYLASGNLANPASEGNVDEAMLPITKYFYDSVQDISENDVGVYVLLAKYQKRLGLDEDYARSVGKVSTLRPDLLDWYLE